MGISYLCCFILYQISEQNTLLTRSFFCGFFVFDGDESTVSDGSLLAIVNYTKITIICKTVTLYSQFLKEIIVPTIARENSVTFYDICPHSEDYNQSRYIGKAKISDK